MDVITDALKIVDNYGNNLKNAYFHEESFIYMKSNERIQDYVDYLLNKRRILSVIGSGDQIINMLISYPEHIDCFDISVYPEYFLNLKLAALQTLIQEEFLNFFFSCAKTSLDEYYDDLYFEKVRKRLTKKYREFWDALLNYTNWYEITNSRLFSSEVVTKEYALKQNMYLDDVVYYSMKDKINDVQFTFHTGDIFKTSSKFRDYYDLVYLSNILAYSDKSQYKELIESFNLTANGYVLTYLFGNLDEYKRYFNGKINNFEESDNGILLTR